MNTLRSRVAVLAIAATLAACGGLKVSMEVLDPAVVQRASDTKLIAGIPTLVVASDEYIQRSVSQLRALHRKGYVKIGELYVEDAKKLGEPQAGTLRKMGEDLARNFDKEPTIKAFYDGLRSDLTRYRDQLRTTLNGRHTVTEKDADYADVLAILRTWQQRYRQVFADIRADIGQYVKTPAQPNGVLSVAQADQLADEIALRQAATLDQVSVQNSPYAFAVASAASDAWKTYNEVGALGRFGATDVAIKLDAKTGNYLLKGLSFDPSDVAAIASKVTTQALLLSAQIAGVPVKSSSAPADGTVGKALADSSSALADAQAELETRRAQDEARRSAMISLANAILDEEAEFDKGGANRTRAIAVLKTAFESRKPLLSSPTKP